MPETASLPAFLPTSRSRVRRHPERAHYDRETVFAILDDALLCRIFYVVDGRPYVTRTLFWREGEPLYSHGSTASRKLRMQRAGIPVCAAVSYVDDEQRLQVRRGDRFMSRAQARQLPGQGSCGQRVIYQQHHRRRTFSANIEHEARVSFEADAGGGPRK